MTNHRQPKTDREILAEYDERHYAQVAFEDGSVPRQELPTFLLRQPRVRDVAKWAGTSPEQMLAVLRYFGVNIKRRKARINEGPWFIAMVAAEASRPLEHHTTLTVYDEE